MTALYGLALLSLGAACALAVRVELQDDADRRIAEMRRLTDEGNLRAATHVAGRGPTHGRLLIGLCVVSGVSPYNGMALLLGP